MLPETFLKRKEQSMDYRREPKRETKREAMPNNFSSRDGKYHKGYQGHYKMDNMINSNHNIQRKNNYKMVEEHVTKLKPSIDKKINEIVYHAIHNPISTELYIGFKKQLTNSIRTDGLTGKKINTVIDSLLKDSFLKENGFGSPDFSVYRDIVTISNEYISTKGIESSSKIDDIIRYRQVLHYKKNFHFTGMNQTGKGIDMYMREIETFYCPYECGYSVDEIAEKMIVNRFLAKNSDMRFSLVVLKKESESSNDEANDKKIDVYTIEVIIHELFSDDSMRDKQIASVTNVLMYIVKHLMY